MFFNKLDPQQVTEILFISDKYGETCIHTICYQSPEIGKALLQEISRAKLKPEQWEKVLKFQEKSAKETVFHVQCKKERHNMLKSIRDSLKLSSEVFYKILAVKNADGKTALHLACTNNRVDCVKILAKLCPDQFKDLSKTEDGSGNNALHLACISGKKDVFAALIENNNGHCQTLLKLGNAEKKKLHCT